MKTLLALALMTVCTIGNAGDIKPTPDEERAVVMAMQGLMERLGDPQWIKLAAEKGEGCWVDKTQLVKEGQLAQFNGVACRCVSWSLTPAKKAYMFFPKRLADACDKAGKPYNECVEELP